MKKFRLINGSTHFFAFIFLPLTFQLSMIAKQNMENYISEEELHEILQNTDEQYVDLAKDYSNLYDIITTIHGLEDNQNSVLGELKQHVDDGFSIGLYSAVVEALEYAEKTIEKYFFKIDPEKAREISEALDTIINEVVNGNCTIPSKKLLSSSKDIDTIMRSCNSVSPSCANQCPVVSPCKVIKVRQPLEVFYNAHFRKNVEVNGKLNVHGKANFKEDVCFDDDVCFKDKVKFYKDVKFKENVLIEGDLTVDGTATFNSPISGLTITDVVIVNLSATDVVVENLSATDIVTQTISATDGFIQNLSVTDLAVANCINNLCVNNLSVTDESVSGTLSAADEIVTNITASTLSATDAVIQNLSVTDLVVLSCVDNLCVTNLSVGDITILSCIDNLCVTNLSVVEETVTGTLSVNDEIVTNITATNLSAADAVIQNASITDATIQSASITDLVVLSCMDNLCVNTLSVGDIVILSCLDSLCINSLSVVDATVSGTLSVSDEIVTNITATNLSATDAVIQNASITDLVVLDCINNLCVTNLSVTDFAVASCMDSLCVNTLSTTDIVAGGISLCDLVVTCDIFMNNSTSAAIGNIFKAGNRFIHNFGTDNTFVGVNAGNFATTGAENVGVGRNALFSNITGFNDVAVGAFAMNTNTIGADNDAIGAFSLVNNTQGNDNAAFGNFTLASNTTGSGNTAVGFQAGYSLATGNNNVFVGNNAGLNLTNGFTNVIAGYNSGLSLTTGNDNIYISNPGIATETGVIRIGTPATHTAAYIQGIFGTAVTGTGIPTFVDANGQLGTVVSSQRFKHDIKDMGNNSENILKLRPVTFVYNNDEDAIIQYGLIAEEVEEAFPALVVRDSEGLPYTVRYHLLPQLLLNEVQKLHSTVQDQAAVISKLVMDNVAMNKAMQKIMKRLNRLAK